MTNAKDADGLAWQVGVWNRMAPVYAQEVDQRFIPVIDQVLLRAKVQPGQNVLDLGTGTETFSRYAESSFPMRITASTSPSTSRSVVRGLMKHGRIARTPLAIVLVGTNGVSRRRRSRSRWFKASPSTPGGGA